MKCGNGEGASIEGNAEIKFRDSAAIAGKNRFVAVPPERRKRPYGDGKTERKWSVFS